MQTDFLIATGLSLLLGSMVGVERQWHRRLVDLKTNALVSLGACLFMLITKSSDGFTDPIRMAGQIVVGVGFIGGGLLFRDGTQTKGINTAATLWCCAAVGALCGLNRWIEASTASLVIVLANTILRKVAQLLNLKMGVNDSLTSEIQFNFLCSTTNAGVVRQEIESILLKAGFEIMAIAQKREGLETSISISFLLEHGDVLGKTESLTQKINALQVTDISWSHI